MGAVARNAELRMCDKCVELDGKIEHYRRQLAGITDQPYT